MSTISVGKLTFNFTCSLSIKYLGSVTDIVKFSRISTDLNKHVEGTTQM
ncbi:7336_t:CDS:2 [Paraglomus occultum]|uniref:7336_t:CDS:1 n=1 Tax=Paraglomus occultum TaxID=144539 RepID=A0A9N9BP93_9GLOM|nr:7336_t:CDS:2 [Paraglomus occultum]